MGRQEVEIIKMYLYPDKALLGQEYTLSEKNACGSGTKQYSCMQDVSVSKIDRNTISGSKYYSVSMSQDETKKSNILRL
ncbi:hypothetical protein Plhal304r1_c030g0097991 [Plasmopara halstedii]